MKLMRILGGRRLGSNLTDNYSSPSSRASASAESCNSLISLFAWACDRFQLKVNPAMIRL